MAKYCAWCGKQIGDSDVFCSFCGKRADGSVAAPQQPQQGAPNGWQQPQQSAPNGWQQPQQGAPQQQWQQPQQQWQAQQPQQQWQSPPPAKRGGKGLIMGIVAAVLVLVVGVGGFVWPGFFKKDMDEGKTDKPKTEATEKPSSTKAPKATKAPKETDAPKPIATPEPKPEPTLEPTPEPTPEPTEPPYVNTFTDVKEGDWYYDAVCWAGKNGVISGTEFKPNDQATRAQALTFLWRAAGSPDPTLKVSPYTDVKESDWYYTSVLWGFENGLISTASDAQFHAGDNLTRAQAITFLCRATDGKAQSGERRFWDAKESDWYFDQANWALENGIIGRDDSYSFSPGATVTRGSLILMLYRTYDPGAKKAATTPPDQSGFAALDLPADDVDIFGPKLYHTNSKNGKELTYSAVVSDYRVFEEDDAYPGKPGYEYRIMTIDLTRVTESDGSGTTHMYLFSDLYNTRLAHSSRRQDENGVFTITVLYQGKLQDYTIWVRSEGITGGLRATYTAQVPKGYDGVVVGYHNNALNASGKSLSEYFTGTEDFALFRMYNLS